MQRWSLWKSPLFSPCSLTPTSYIHLPTDLGRSLNISPRRIYRPISQEPPCGRARPIDGSHEEAREVWIIPPRQPISASNTHRCWTGVVSGECHRVQRSQSGERSSEVSEATLRTNHRLRWPPSFASKVLCPGPLPPERTGAMRNFGEITFHALR